MQDLPQGGALVDLIAPALGHDEDGDAQDQADGKAGAHAGGEQGAHGDGGGGAVYDHGDGRGNDGAHGGGGGGDAEDGIVVIALVPHGLDLYAAQAAHVRQSGAGHTGEQEGGQNVYIGQAAGQVAQKGAAEIKDTVGDAAVVHNDTGRHEHGDGQQDEAVQTAVHLGHDGHVVNAAVEERIAQTAGQQRHVDGRAAGQKHHEYGQINPEC